MIRKSLRDYLYKFFINYISNQLKLSNNCPSNGNPVRRFMDIPRSRRRWQAESALAESVIVRVPLTIRSLSLSAFVLWMNVEPALGSPPLVLLPAIPLPPPTRLQPSSLCHRLTLVRLASAIYLRHLFLSLFSPPPPLFSPALCPSFSEAERVWLPLIRTLRSSEQQSRPETLGFFDRLTSQEARGDLKT